MTDETFEETLARLRVRYLEKARERCARLDGLLEQLVPNDARLDAIEEIRQTLHKFSGSGATYGFPRVSELGLQGELTCDDILKRASEIRHDEIEALRQLVAGLHVEFVE